MVVAFRRNCHGPRKLVGRFRFEGVHCRLWSRSDRAHKKRWTVRGEIQIARVSCRPTSRSGSDFRSAHESAFACESRAQYGRRFLPRIPAVRLICAGGAARRTIARGEPSGCTHDDADRCAQGRLPRAWISIRRLGKQPYCHNALLASRPPPSSSHSPSSPPNYPPTPPPPLSL